jgi:hypothetical protein
MIVIIARAMIVVIVIAATGINLYFNTLYVHQHFLKIIRPVGKKYGQFSFTSRDITYAGRKFFLAGIKK